MFSSCQEFNNTYIESHIRETLTYESLRIESQTQTRTQRSQYNRRNRRGHNQRRRHDSFQRHTGRSEFSFVLKGYIWYQPSNSETSSRQDNNGQLFKFRIKVKEINNGRKSIIKIKIKLRKHYGNVPFGLTEREQERARTERQRPNTQSAPQLNPPPKPNHQEPEVQIIPESVESEPESSDPTDTAPSTLERPNPNRQSPPPQPDRERTPELDPRIPPRRHPDVQPIPNAPPLKPSDVMPIPNAPPLTQDDIQLIPLAPWPDQPSPPSIDPNSIEPRDPNTPPTPPREITVEEIPSEIKDKLGEVLFICKNRLIGENGWIGRDVSTGETVGDVRPHKVELDWDSLKEKLGKIEYVMEDLIIGTKGWIPFNSETGELIGEVREPIGGSMNVGQRGTRVYFTDPNPDDPHGKRIFREGRLLDPITGETIHSTNDRDPALLEQLKNEFDIQETERIWTNEYAKNILRNRKLIKEINALPKDQREKSTQYKQLIYHNDSDMRKPLLIVFAARDDHNGFLRSSNHDMLAETHNIIYYEANSDEELEAAFQELRGAGLAGQLNEQNVVFMGHGSKTLMALGARDVDGPDNQEEIHLDTSDQDQFAQYADLFAGANIHFHSCSNGEGKGDDNLIASASRSFGSQAESLTGATTTVLPSFWQRDEDGNLTYNYHGYYGHYQLGEDELHVIRPRQQG